MTGEQILEWMSKYTASLKVFEQPTFGRITFELRWFAGKSKPDLKEYQVRRQCLTAQLKPPTKQPEMRVHWVSAMIEEANTIMKNSGLLDVNKVPPDITMPPLKPTPFKKPADTLPDELYVKIGKHARHIKTILEGKCSPAEIEDCMEECLDKGLQEVADLCEELLQYKTSQVKAYVQSLSNQKLPTA